MFFFNLALLFLGIQDLFIDDIVFIDGDNNPTNTSVGNSGPSTGGTPGGPSNPQNNSVSSLGGGLPRDESSNTLGSNASHTNQEYAEAKASELLNVSNILDDKNLSDEDKKEQVLKAFAKLSNEAIAKDAQINKLKNSGQIDIKLDDALI